MFKIGIKKKNLKIMLRLCFSLNFGPFSIENSTILGNSRNSVIIVSKGLAT
jgi:hypothetical protein